MGSFVRLFLILFCFAFVTVTFSQSNVPSYVPTNGLVGWWPFNGNANDASGNNNNGTLTGGQYSTGRGGLTNTALLFNSSAAGYVDVNLTNSISGQFSVMMWIRADRSSTYVGESTVCPGGVSVPMANSNQNWAMIPGNGGSNLGVGLSFVQNGIMVGEHANNILVSRLSHSNNSTTFNQVIIVYRTDSTFLYLNGLKVRSRAIYCSTNNKFIGPSIRFGGSLYAPNFAGIIDDIGIWNRALSQQEINGLYNSIDPFSISATNSTVCAGQPTTLSVQSLTGTITALNCASATNSGALTSGTAASGVSSSVPYTGGNAGTHNGQTVTSTGVSGLTATLTSGTFASGNGSLTYTITGTPSTGGTASFALNIGGKTCTLTRTVGLPVGTITALSCGTATNTGTLTAGSAASGVSSAVPYTGGNGGTHNGQTVTSTGVTGLTATLSAGTFASGSGSLTYTISGTPSVSGTANFVLNIGGQTCTLNLTVNTPAPAYPAGTVHCNGTPTAVVDVTNPATGKTWMDRNLGASQVATSSTDANAYGDLYQWGRRADGHQCRTSSTTTTLSSIDTPAHGSFILVSGATAGDWRDPGNNNLWQGLNGTNNPCPAGYRVPSNTELNTERLSWSQNNIVGAFDSPLKLTAGGGRLRNLGSNGAIVNIGQGGAYWTSTISGVTSVNITFGTVDSGLQNNIERADGNSVRCIKN